MASENSEESRKIFLQMLEAYQEHRCLWDMGCPQYANREFRNQAYNVLLQIYKKLHPNANTEMLKRKLENMRTAYKRELKKIKDSIKKGAETQDIYSPKLWYFHHLTFLDDKEYTRIGTDTLHETDEEDSNEALAFTRSQTAPTPPPKKAHLTIQRKQEKLIETTQSLSSKEDYWEVIGKSLGLQLQQLSEDQQIVAQKLFSDIIFYGKLNKLTEHSSIQLYPCVPPITTYHSPSNRSTRSSSSINNDSITILPTSFQSSPPNHITVPTDERAYNKSFEEFLLMHRK